MKEYFGQPLELPGVMQRIRLKKRLNQFSSLLYYLWRKLRVLVKFRNLFRLDNLIFLDKDNMKDIHTSTSLTMETTLYLYNSIDMETHH